LLNLLQDEGVSLSCEHLIATFQKRTFMHFYT
ncbi:MAG: hypothetical protein RIQ31_204, partial [Actinomycetota bacterium]